MMQDKQEQPSNKPNLPIEVILEAQWSGYGDVFYINDLELEEGKKYRVIIVEEISEEME